MNPRSPMIEASAEFSKKGQEGHRASKSALRQFGENAFLAMKKMKDSIGDFLDDENVFAQRDSNSQPLDPARAAC